MKKTLVLILLLSFSFTATSQGYEGIVIFDHNPTYIDEFTNPITLNWTIESQFLRSHEIYQGESLLDYQNYSQNSLNPVNTSVTLSFTLGNGRYKFTILARDNVSTTTSEFEVLKGVEPTSLATLRVADTWLISGVLLVTGLRQKKMSK